MKTMQNSKRIVRRSMTRILAAGAIGTIALAASLSVQANEFADGYEHHADSSYADSHHEAHVIPAGLTIGFNFGHRGFGHLGFGKSYYGHKKRYGKRFGRSGFHHGSKFRGNFRGSHHGKRYYGKSYKRSNRHFGHGRGYSKRIYRHRY